jgi:hypothetical protein
MYRTLRNQALEVTEFCRRIDQSPAAFSGNGAK